MSKLDREKWDARYREESYPMGEPSSFLASIEDLLPASGSCLDVAGGAGRHAVWLAQRGLDVTLADISEVGLGLAREKARVAGVELTLQVMDLESESLPAGPWDVIVVLHYLLRPLFASLHGALVPGGLLLFAHATHRNLERNPRPPAEYLLADGEAPSLVRDLEIIRYREGWFDDGRHEARLVARRPS